MIRDPVNKNLVIIMNIDQNLSRISYFNHKISVSPSLRLCISASAVHSLSLARRSNKVLICHLPFAIGHLPFAMWYTGF